jgi:signal transduction histidine kinase
MHHFLIDPDEIYSQEILSLLSAIEKKTKAYKAEEEVEPYPESEKEVRLANIILEDIKGLKELPAIFEEFSRTGKFDKDKIVELEEYAYHIESSVKEINKIHFFKIAEWDEESLTYMWIILILYGGFITLGGLAVYVGHRFLSKMVVEPIKKLASAAIEFSEGNFDKRVHTDSKTEIGLLYRSFNEMADKIQEHNEFLRRFNEELEKKVRERTLELQKANEQLRRTQDALIRTEKIAAIGQIATGVTHEIKTPLNSLAVNIQMLLRDIKDKCGPDECKFYEVASLIQCEIKRINNILDNFVGFAKFPEPKFMPNDINQIIKEVATFISHSAKENGVKVDLSLADDIPVFRFDRPQIKEVLMNLSHNALHAMPHGGVLKIATSMRNNSVIINVSDTGVGIPESNLEKIFTPFFSTKDGGLGLGLAIVQRIVEGHGGKINCKSKVGEGTVFEITLPFEKD